jgi:hypothetical protein
VLRIVDGLVCAAAAAVMVGGVLAACGSIERAELPAAERVDCDREDLAKHEPDCGYWDASGHFWVWYWVNPMSGGVAPYGWHPAPPPGASTRRPPNAKTGGKPSVQAPPGPAIPRPPAGTAARPAPPAGTVRNPAPKPPAPPKVNPPAPPPRYVPPPPPRPR